MTNTPAPEYVTWRAFLRGGYGAPLALVCLSVWLHAADSLLVATMLPAIVADIGGAAFVSWTVSIYEVGSVVAGAASALMSMRYGLRRPMAAAACVFALGCAASAISPSMQGVLVGRALQGLGGGGLVALGFVAAGVLFPRHTRARVMAVVSTFWGMSAFLGPLLGGAFVEYATWRIGFGVFALQATALAVWIWSREDALPPSAGKTTARFPVVRLAMLCLAVVLISAGGVRVELLRSTLLITAGLACLIWFVWRDARAGEDRLLPAKAVNPFTATGGTMLMLLMISMSTIAILAYGPILMTFIYQMPPLMAGYIIACSSIGWTVAAVAISGVTERYDRLCIGLGMATTALSVAGFAYAVPNGPIWLIAVFALIEGAGFGLAWTFILRRITALVPKDEVQRVSGAMPTVQRIGYALGAAYVGIIANAAGFIDMQTASDAARIAQVLFVSCLPLAALGVLAMLGLLRRHPHDATL